MLTGFGLSIPSSLEESVVAVAPPTTSTPDRQFTVTNTNDRGAGSLRWAIEQANEREGPDIVAFNIQDNGSNIFQDADSHLPGGDAEPDVFVIRPQTPLPRLADDTGGTRIDGGTQTLFGGNSNPFGPEIVLDGSRVVDDPADGISIWLHADGNQIVALNIHSFSGNGISIVRSDNNVVSGNYIGTDPTGTAPLANGMTMKRSAGGILISAGANGNLVGTDADGANDEAERNVLSGNYRHGVRMQRGSLRDETSGNVVRGNYIGTDASGRVVEGLGNRTHAVQFVQSGSANGVYANFVTGNVIAGNGVGEASYFGTSATENPLIGNQDSPSGIASVEPDLMPVPVNDFTTGIPVLNSLTPSQINNDTKTIYLDFDGHAERFWATVGVQTFPGTDVIIGGMRINFYAANDPFTMDDEAWEFTQRELDVMRDIHQRVAEDFAPFNVNVTTVEPHRFARGESVRVAIGGCDGDWFTGYQRWQGPVERAAGGELGFHSTVFVFSDTINFGTELQAGPTGPVFACRTALRHGDFQIAGRNASAISHEVGHSFGLEHISSRTEEYDPGDDVTTPIMGASASDDDRTIWWNGPTPGTFATNDGLDPAFQSDLYVLGQAIGYRDDDHSSSIRSATRLNDLTVTYVQDDPRFAPKPVYQAVHHGIIERMNDRDYFSFRHEGGEVSIRVDAYLDFAFQGANMNARLELRDLNDRVIARSHEPESVLGNPDAPGSSTSIGWIDPNDIRDATRNVTFEQLSAAIPSTRLAARDPRRYTPSNRLVLGPGTYYVVVMSEGGYGDLGRYTLSVSGIRRDDKASGAWGNVGAASPAYLGMETLQPLSDTQSRDRELRFGEILNVLPSGTLESRRRFDWIESDWNPDRDIDHRMVEWTDAVHDADKLDRQAFYQAPFSIRALAAW